MGGRDWCHRDPTVGYGREEWLALVAGLEAERDAAYRALNSAGHAYHCSTRWAEHAVCNCWYGEHAAVIDAARKLAGDENGL
jgi:hypothetical protein